MSEVLRELVVSLSLESDNFARNMRTINQQIKEAESTFKLAGAGVDNFEKTVGGTQAKLTMLSSKLQQQNRAVEQYSRALLAANQKLSDSYARQERLKASLGMARTEMERAKQSVQQARNTYHQYASSLGESNSATIAAKNNLDMAEQEYKEAADKVKLLEGQIKSNTKTLQNNADAIAKVKTNLNNAKAAVKETKTEIKRMSEQLVRLKSKWTSTGEALTAFSKKCETLSKTMITMGRGLTTTITTPILALGTAAVKSSISYESAFTSVRKTVNMTEAEFAELSEEIKQMSTEIAVSADDIAEVVAIAGQLGIENDHLMEFTRTMIDLGNSTDIVASEAASELAKFANIMSMDQSQFGNLGATLVELGNNYATTESSIMSMSMRLAAAGKQVGLTEAQILGFATALSSVGIEAEMGGSAFSKALVKMEVAAATGGEALDDFATVSGMTAEQFQVLWNNDPSAAFQSFIVGLARMDDEGVSAIATLQEIGINEIRLRDTLLRAVNATDLFAETQATATNAWAENSALSEEANKRYATTASRLTNLKNKAMLFAQQLGDDLNPTIKELITNVDGILDSFLSMDDSTRMQAIKMAALAAAIGPVTLAFGKVTKGIGSFTAGLGKFATSVAKAGGGAKGFFSVLGKSPAFWAAIAAATITATVAIYDYVTGAKQAREALEGMKATAEKWKTTAASTFYGSSNGLSAFGMSSEDFKREVGDAQSWITGLIEEWNDGKRETDEEVTYWTDSLKKMTSTTRTELQHLQEVADEGGYAVVSRAIAEDIASLDAIDAEIEKLLKNRQRGLLSASDQKRLQQLIEIRDSIEVKYSLTTSTTEGFDTIRKKMEAEIARAQAKGMKDAAVASYEDALVAAAEGMATIQANIDETYDSEYEVIMLMEDAAERQAALDALNIRYLAERREAAVQYGELLADLILPVWNQEDIQKTGSDIADLTQLMRELTIAGESEKPGILAEMNTLTAGMDESALAEYVSMLMQIQSLLDSGMSEAEVNALFPDIDYSTALEQIAAIQAFLKTRPDALPGLTTMFGEALPEEALRIATDLDMTGAQERWNEFAANPGAITTDAVINKTSLQGNSSIPAIMVDAFIGRYTEVEEGADTSTLTPAGLTAYVSTYAETVLGADLTRLTPTNITALVAGYEELAAGADTSMLTPSDITAYIAAYMERNNCDTTGLTPDMVTAFVLAYEEVKGGASTAALMPSNVAAMVTKYLQADGIDISTLSSSHITAIITAFAEATGCDKSQLLKDFTAYISQYDDSNAVRPRLTMNIGLSGYDLVAYRRFIEENPVEVEGIIRLGETYGNPDSVITDPNAVFWKEGAEIPVTAVTEEMLTANSVAVLEEDGTVHVLVTPQITGTGEAIKQLEATLHSTENQGSLGAKWFGMDTMDDLIALNKYLQKVQSDMNSFLNIGGWMDNWNRTAAAQTTDNYLDPEEMGNLQTYVGEAVATLNSGQPVSAEMLTNLEQIVSLIKYMEGIGFGSETMGGFAEIMTNAGLETTADTLIPNLEQLIVEAKAVGTDVASGVGEGMASTNMTTYADTVAANTEAALRGGSAFNSASPANRTKPVGQDVALGIGVGMIQTNLTPYASMVAAAVTTALRTSFALSGMQSIGSYAMSGLAAGIRSGQSGVVVAMRTAAEAAVSAAKQELDIQSPSRVFRDEVGAMVMEGFGEGVLEETKNQSQIIRNASRYLTGEAQAGTIVSNSSNNRQSYDNSVSSTVQVGQMVIRDEQDIHSLAIEIASLTKRQQRGKGMKNA